METIGTRKTPERKITFEEIAELEQPIRNIIGKIGERIERGEYGIIIGDDASGRIPALILGGFIKRISKLKNRREPNIIFIPGKLFDREGTLSKKLEEHLAAYGVKESERILVVTESIQNGKSLNVLSSLLKGLDLEFDIATIGIDKSADRFYEKARKENLQDSTIISGEYVRKGLLGLSNTPLIYSQGRGMNGVFKSSGDLKSQPIKSGIIFTHSPGHKTPIQDKINKSRVEASILVDKLVDWYLSQADSVMSHPAGAD